MWLLLFLFLTKPVFAQDSTDLFTQYRNDYFYQRDLYQKNYFNYLNTKDVYSQYRTLISEKDKIDSTKTVLFSRNLMLKSYFMALRVGLDKYKTINPSNTEISQIENKKWEAWLDEQNLIIPNFNNLSDIKTWSTEFKSRYIEIQRSIYTSLTQSQINLRLQILADIKSLADNIRNDPKNQNYLDDWYANYPVKSDLINKSLQSAAQLCNRTQRNKNFNNFYPEVIIEINRADGYLKNLITDLRSATIKLNN